MPRVHNFTPMSVLTQIYDLAWEHPYMAGSVAFVGLLAAYLVPRPGSHRSPAQLRAAAAAESWESHVVEDKGGLVEVSRGRLWTVNAQGTAMGPPERRMMIYRPPAPDGGQGTDLIVHSAISVGEDLMDEITALGKPAVLVVPNDYHRNDAAVWKVRFPDMQVCCPPAGRKKVGDIVDVDFDAVALEDRFPDAVRARALNGWVKDADPVWEYAFEFRLADGSWAFVVTDELMNMRRPDSKLSALIGGMFGSYGGEDGKHPRVGNLGKWYMHDKATVAAHFDGLAARDDVSVIAMAHGEVVTGSTEEIQDAFRSAAASLR